MFCKKGLLKNIYKFTGLRSSTWLKKRLWHRCFTVSYPKFLRKLFLIENLWWLFIYCHFELNFFILKLYHNKFSIVSGYPFSSSPNFACNYLVPKPNHTSFNVVWKILLILILIRNSNQGDVNMELTELTNQNIFYTSVSIINCSNKPKHYQAC